MRRFGMALTLCLAGCSATNNGDDAAKGCTSAIVGTWQGTTQGDEISLSSNGAFRYAGADGCISTGTFACPDKSVTTGTMQVSVASSAGGACLPAGS